MTKIAYIRASQQNPGLQFGSPNSSPIKSPIMPPAQNRVFFQPPMPGAQPVLGAFNPQPVARSAVASSVPKPMIMAPTTRFNSNPTVNLDDGQGGRISKPLMEKRRRARINQCLSQLKQIVVDSAGQYTENNKCKLEKADILELTVKYVKKLHFEVTEPSSSTSSDPMTNSSQGYVTGYSDCIRQICDIITDIPEIAQTPALRDSLESHLSQCLHSIQNQSQNSSQSPVGPFPPSPPNSSNSSVPFGTFCTPPSPAPSAESNLSSSSSTSSLSPLSIPIAPQLQGLKREFSDDDEYDDVSDEEDDPYDPSGPINLSKVPKLNGETWRPW